MESAEIKYLAKSIGADLVGIAPASTLEGIPGYSPSKLQPGAKSVIVMAKRLLQGSLGKGRGQPVAWATIHLNLKLNEIAYEVARHLEDEDYGAFPIFFLYMTFFPPEDERGRDSILATPNFSYVPASLVAGLGERGLNNLLITPEYGPRMRLVVVISDATLRPDEPRQEELCPGLECGLCMEAVPPGPCSAKKNTTGSAATSIYYNAHLHLLGYGSCSMCMQVCPIPQ